MREVAPSKESQTYLNGFNAALQSKGSLVPNHTTSFASCRRVLRPQLRYLQSCSLTFLQNGSKFQNRAGSSSVRMEIGSTATTVPSIVVYVTVPNKEEGKKLAESLVREKLAACVNRVPGIESVYQWQGEVQTDAEELLIIKTRQSLLDALTEHVNKNHPYDVPEVIALPITGGSVPYLEWIKNSTRDSF